MRAAGPSGDGATESSPRELATQALERFLDREHRYTARFVTAGDRPGVLGDSVTTSAEATRVLEEWRCESGHSTLDEAITLAAELGGPLARLLVLTDSIAPPEIGDGRIEWWSFGRARENVAIVSAARTPSDQNERCLFEILNLGEEPARRRLTVQVAGEPQPREDVVLPLRPGESRRFTYTLSPGAGEIRATLEADALPLDDSVTLLPRNARPVRTQLSFRNADLREAVVRGLRATGRAEIVGDGADLLLTDDPDSSVSGTRTWIVRFLALPDGVTFEGPFIVEKTHPLTAGLSLAGVFWGASREEIPGRPLLSVGNVTLIATEAAGGTRHDTFVNLRLGLSRIVESTAWPVLFWNLLEWRSEFAPGPRATNLRLGTEGSVVLPRDAKRARIRSPRGEEQLIALTDAAPRIALRADEIGRYVVESVDRDPPVEYEIAVHPLRRDESDLKNGVTGSWGRWVDDPSLRRHYASVAWALLLFALAALCVHQVLAARAARTRRLT